MREAAARAAVSCSRSLGRTRAEEARVRLRNGEPECAAELEDISGVLGGGRVAEVTEDLDACGDTRNGLALNPPEDEALGRVPEGATPGLRLHTAALRVEADRVEVELLAVAPQDEPNRQMILVQGEAKLPKGLLDSRDVAESDY